MSPISSGPLSERKEIEVLEESLREQAAEIAALRVKVLALAALARRMHTYCEDSWYSCPADPDGCCDDRKPAGVCNCGADEINAQVDAILRELEEER